MAVPVKWVRILYMFKYRKKKKNESFIVNKNKKTIKNNYTRSTAVI